MKIRDLKPGQLFAAHFPYHRVPELRDRNYGYRVLELDERFLEKDGYDGYAALVKNVKTGVCSVFGFPETAENHGNMPPNWTLLENAQ
jgi:hypothetical protein